MVAPEVGTRNSSWWVADAGWSVKGNRVLPRLAAKRDREPEPAKLRSRQGPGGAEWATHLPLWETCGERCVERATSAKPDELSVGA